MNFHDQTYPFSLVPLPYPYDSMEPHIGEETMHYHHDKHLKTYIDNLNKVLANHPEYHNLRLDELLKRLNTLPESIQTEVRNNAGGVLNHYLYFYSLRPVTNMNSNTEQVTNADSAILAYPGKVLPSLPILNDLISSYGSFYNFRDAFKNAALKQFGSGYAWLVLTPNKVLAIVMTNNQDNPIMAGLTPLLPLDVWEHAYYLDRRNQRNAYIENFFPLINWDAINYRYLNAMNS